jgi:hypothetical protein
MVSPSLIVELVSSIVSESENVYGELDILIAKKECLQVFRECGDLNNYV